MGLNTEEDNAKGYHESNVNLAEKAKNFLGKKLLLMHATGDRKLNKM